MVMFCEGPLLGRGLRKKIADKIATAKPLATDMRNSRIYNWSLSGAAARRFSAAWLPVSPQPQNGKGPGDCREIAGGRKPDKAGGLTEMESYEGACDPDKAHGYIARAPSKPASAIAIDEQSRDNSNDENNRQRLKCSRGRRALPRYLPARRDFPLHIARRAEHNSLRETGL
jgi:hypothetical protein